MVVQQPQRQPGKEPARTPYLRSVTNIADLAAYSSFGSLLSAVRENSHLTQAEAAASFPPYFAKYHVPTLDEAMYGHLERGRRYPAFAELLPLYEALTAGCGMVFSESEQALYLHLARKKIEQKKRRKERISEEAWEKLDRNIAEIDPRPRLVGGEEASAEKPLISFPPASAPYTAPVRVTIDTSHILGRDSWAAQMLSYFQMAPAKKIIDIQALSGTGKTTGLKLLCRHLEEDEGCLVLSYPFTPTPDMTPADYLDTFLADVLTKLHLPQPETTTPPLTQRIEQVITAILHMQTQGKRVVFLLDDYQMALEENGELSPAWREFFTAFMQYEHQAALYLATREWPTWTGREHTFFAETELPPFSVDDGVTLWRRLDFRDVPEDLLRLAAQRCGGNPQLIELLATSLTKPKLVFAWHTSGEVRSRRADRSEHQILIEKLLEKETLFANTRDAVVREVLDQVLSRRLSQSAIELLELLAASPLALPFSYLEETCPQAELAFDELVHCSLVERDTTLATGRAHILSFVREAGIHRLQSQGRNTPVVQQVTAIYERWLTSEEFLTDQEKALVVTELIIQYTKQGRLLDAAQLLLTYGWLCSLFGQLARLERIYSQTKPKTPITPEQEAGNALLFYHLALLAGSKYDPWERDRAYKAIRSYAQIGQIALEPHTHVYLAHYLMLPFIRSKRFSEAYQLLTETRSHIEQHGPLPQAALAAYLHSTSYLLGRWSEEESNPDEVGRLRTECVAALRDGIALWRQSRANTLPIQESYVNFRLARALNDYAYYLRLLGHFDEAKEAIEECLRLKESGATLPRSLAVSLGEYAQILACLGIFQDALTYNGQALQKLDSIFAQGDQSAQSDKGMLLVERSLIFMQQARWKEAQQGFETALDLLSETRSAYRTLATQRLETLTRQVHSRSQLDSRWFERYLALASYDDIPWLVATGPFTPQEQDAWQQLQANQDDSAQRRRADLLVQSRQRELEESIATRRTPRLLYSAIPIEEVREKIRGFERLQAEIETQEENAVVRRLYKDTITEHLHTLHLVESVYNQDCRAVMQHNLFLYGGITALEMAEALTQLFLMLKYAKEHPQAAPLAERMLRQLKSWHLQMEDYVDREQPATPKLVAKKPGKTVFSAQAVQRFFTEVLAEYHFGDWKAVLSYEREHTSVDLDLCTVFIPGNAHFSAMKICELLAEEIETHAFRSVAGRKSPLALLGSGTQGFLPTEEGLAVNYILEAAAAHGFRKSYSWITTLAPGLAAGVVTPPLSFLDLYDFLYTAFLISNLLSGKYDTEEEVRAGAKAEALSRTTRTFRGIPDLSVSGACSLKDRVYLQGYLEVSNALQQMPRERLLVGSIGIARLADMAELNLHTPAIVHRRKALDPDLFEQIARFEE